MDDAGVATHDRAADALHDVSGRPVNGSLAGFLTLLGAGGHLRRKHCHELCSRVAQLDLVPHGERLQLMVSGQSS